MTQFEQTFSLMKKPLIIAPYIILTLLIYQFLDKYIATYFYQLDTRNNWPIFKFFTSLGAVVIYFTLFLGVGLHFRYVKINAVYEAKAWYLLSCITLSNIFCLIIKTTLSRARPLLLFTDNLFGFYLFKFHAAYWSFPSGHTMTIISLVAGLSILVPRYFYRLLLVAFFVVLSRVVLYYHYLSDVMTGFYLSILIIGFFTQYLKTKDYLNKAWENKNQ